MATTTPAKSFEFAGYKENFADYIATLSPFKTPFLDCVGTDVSRNYNVQWVTDHNTPLYNLTDIVPSPEGREFLDNDGIDEAMVATQEEIVSNFAQKFTRRVAVSESAAAINVYGRRNEVKYQLDKAAVDLKRQLEMVIFSVQDKADGTPTTGRKMGGLATLIAAPQRVSMAGATLALADLEAAWKSIYDADSEADVIFCHPDQVKELIALKDGTGAMPALQVFKDVTIEKPNGETIHGQKEHLTITDQFGKVWVIIPCRNVIKNTFFFIDPEEVDVVYFRKPVVGELSPTGSAQRYFVECEATVRLRSPNKCAVILPKP